MHKSISALALEANVHDSEFDLIGDGLDDRFEIKFKGSSLDHSKALRQQFYSSLQLGRGKWKKQAVLDSANAEVQFYVQPDKNPAQIKREVATKTLRDLVQGLVPANKEVWAKRDAGTLYVDKRRLLTITIQGELSAHINWSHPKRVSLGLDQAQIETELRNFLLGEGGSSS